MNHALRRSRMAAIAVLLPVFCIAKSAKISSDLATRDPQSVADVIVQFHVKPDAAQHSRIAQLGGVRRADMDLIEASLYSIPVRALEALANNPNIRYVSPDREVQATLDITNPSVGAQYALSLGYDGTGVGVAVIDSGILSEPDFSDKAGGPSSTRIVYNQSFVAKVTSTSDQFGHGTHV